MHLFFRFISFFSYIIQHEVIIIIMSNVKNLLHDTHKRAFINVRKFHFQLTFIFIIIYYHHHVAFFSFSLGYFFLFFIFKGPKSPGGFLCNTKKWDENNEKKKKKRNKLKNEEFTPFSIFIIKSCCIYTWQTCQGRLSFLKHRNVDNVRKESIWKEKNNMIKCDENLYRKKCFFSLHVTRYFKIIKLRCFFSLTAINAINIKKEGRKKRRKYNKKIHQRSFKNWSFFRFFWRLIFPLKRLKVVKSMW